jgi:glycosyltransferase involved in cell wall biosynthesis
MNTLDGFSIVVCTHNGVNKLRPTIEHIAGLTVPAKYQVELILVDNASNDNTTSFVNQLWTEIGSPFQLQVLSEHRPGKGYAVEVGYDAANYSYIITVDDDNWLAADYLLVAQHLLCQHPDVGILQGKNTAVFEVSPPAWLPIFEYNFVIGSPIKQSGYFEKDNFHVWGAGMVIERASWVKLRNLGFAFLTSKVPGKAAGEDNETAMALMLLGRRVYYSNKLNYKHFMPASRIKWSTLKMNYEVYGYIKYFFFLYASVIDSHNNKYLLTATSLKKKFFSMWFYQMKRFTIKQHVAYLIKPREESYQLSLAYNYSVYRTFVSASKNMMNDVAFLQSWMLPIMEQSVEGFNWAIVI